MSDARLLLRSCLAATIAAPAPLAGAGEAFGEPTRATTKTSTMKAQKGHASFYGRNVGTVTASGEPMHSGRLTAASRTLPLGSRAKVTNLRSGRSVTVRINDRGPYVRGRIIDVSRRAAERLGMIGDGVARVTVQPLAAP